MIEDKHMHAIEFILAWVGFLIVCRVFNSSQKSLSCFGVGGGASGIMESRQSDEEIT
jgi:hypothetical protein